MVVFHKKQSCILACTCPFIALLYVHSINNSLDGCSLWLINILLFTLATVLDTLVKLHLINNLQLQDLVEIQLIDDQTTAPIPFLQLEVCV